MIASSTRLTSLELAHLRAPERLIPLPLADSHGTRDWSGAAQEQWLRNASLLEAHVSEKHGIPTTAFHRDSLIDDVLVREQQRVSSDAWRLQLFINLSSESVVRAIGATVHFEASFIERGRALQTTLLERARELKLPVDNEEKVLIPSTKSFVAVRLSGFKGVADPHHPSCAVLDLAWIEWRLQNYSRVFTALPLKYLAQQRQVAALTALAALPGRERVTTLFVDESF